MIVVTGAYGFIGSCLVTALNQRGLGRQIIVVDDFYKDRKEANLGKKIVREWIHRDIFLPWFEKMGKHVDVVFHMGARTDTALQDKDVFDRLNEEYTQSLWRICAENDVQFIYASSAAVYGDGALGFSDEESLTPHLKPLNPYGQSKRNIDEWILEQESAPSKWAGFRFFNVFGPNEYHKGRMASVFYHFYRQIQKEGCVHLFKSHRKDYEDGQQLRDFIYIKDVINALFHAMDFKVKQGVYNLGRGEAHSFNDVVDVLFEVCGVAKDVRYIDIPTDIREAYQYHTQADMEKFKSQGWKGVGQSLEDDIRDYVTNYLQKSYTLI